MAHIIHEVLNMDNQIYIYIYIHIYKIAYIDIHYIYRLHIYKTGIIFPIPCPRPRPRGRSLTSRLDGRAALALTARAASCRGVGMVALDGCPPCDSGLRRNRRHIGSLNGVGARSVGAARVRLHRPQARATRVLGKRLQAVWACSCSSLLPRLS